jgi:C4-dicarboxylate-specific signal transduction histidine kinase
MNVVSFFAFAMTLLRFARFCLPLLLLCQQLNGQYLNPLLSGYPVIRHFSPNEYKGGPVNFALIQDLRGLMYVGNEQGVIEFDGHSWRKPINLEYKNVVSCMARTSMGRIYIGGKDGIQPELGYLTFGKNPNRPRAPEAMHFRSLTNYIPAQDRLNFKNIWSVVPTHEGVYFLADNYLFRWDETKRKMRQWVNPQGTNFMAFYINGTFYLHDLSKGLLQLDNDQLVPVAQEGNELTGQRVMSMLPVSPERVLIAIDNKGKISPNFYLLEGKNILPFKTEADNYLSQHFLYCGAKLTDSTFVFGTRNGGLISIDHQGRILQVVNEKNGLRNNQVMGLYPDLDGGLWVASQNGLDRIGRDFLATAQNPQLRSLYGNFSPSSPSNLQGFIRDVVLHQGTLYVATTSGLYYRAPQATWNATRDDFRRVPGVDRSVEQLLVIGNDLLAGGKDIGVIHVMDGNIQSQIHVGEVQRLCASQRYPNTVYVGQSDGVAGLEKRGGIWESKAKVENFLFEVHSMAEASDGHLWVCTKSNGIYQFPFTAGYSRFVNCTEHKEGVSAPDENYVFRLGDELFFGLNQRGMARYAAMQNAFVSEDRFSPDDKIFSNGDYYIHNLFKGPDGTEWIVAQEALSGFSSALMGSGSSGANKNINFRYVVFKLTKDAKGQYQKQRMPFDRFLDSKPQALTPLSNGLLYIGSKDELIQYHLPTAQKRRAEPQTPLIRSVYINAGSVYPRDYRERSMELELKLRREVNNAADARSRDSLNRALALLLSTKIDSLDYLFKGTWTEMNDQDTFITSIQDPDQKSRIHYRKSNRYIFRWACPTFEDPEFTEYRYRLQTKGSESGSWSAWSDKTEVEFTNLESDNYELVVQARNAHGQETAISKFEFVVFTPIERWFVWFLFIIGGIAFFIAVVKYREARLKQEKERLEEIVKARTFELEERKDELEKNKEELQETVEMLTSQKRTVELQKDQIERQNNSLEEKRKEVENKNTILEDQKKEIEAQKTVLEAQNDQLQKAYSDLEVAQAEKVQAQRMAAFSEITPILAHEINTPIGAIQNGLSYIQGTYVQTLKELPVLMADLSMAAQEDFWAIVEALHSNPQPSMTSTEERKRVRQLEPDMEALGLQEPEEMAAQIVKLGISHRYNEFLPFIQVLDKTPRLMVQLQSVGSLSKQLQNVDNSTKKIKDIVEYLRNSFSSSASESQVTRINVVDNIRLVLKIYDYYLKQGIVIEEVYPPEPVFTHAAAQSLKQVWTNLVMSAVHAMNDKFHQEGQYARRLRIELTLDQNRIHIHLSDNARLLTEEEQATVFNPAELNPRRIDPPINLAICRTLLEEYQGQIDLQVDEQWNTFSIHLPSA